MARNGAGTYVLPLADVVANTTILAAWANTTLADVAAALTASIAKDGQTQPTANLPMNGYRHTSVGNPNARDQYASVAGIQDGTYIWGGTAGGTANAITVTLAPALTAYAAGQIIAFLATAVNTSVTVTINVNGLGTKNLKRPSESAVRIGDIPAAGALVFAMYDGTQFRLLNPYENPYNPMYYFSGYLTSDQTLTSGSLTVLSGFTEEDDAGARFGVYYYVVPQTGLYEIDFCATLQTNTGNVTENFIALITDDTGGTVYARGSNVCPSAVGSNAVITSSGTLKKRFTALDKISLSAFHVTGTDRDVLAAANYTRLSINFLGP